MPRFVVKDVELFERFVCFNKPFRFGSVTVEGAPQAFVRVEIEIEGYGRSTGAGAEMMMPKWFDKRESLTPDESINELRRSLAIARALYLTGANSDCAFGWHAARIEQQIQTCAAEDIPPLAACYGPAEIDKAIVDALLRAVGLGVYDGLGKNIVGLDARLTPDIQSAAIATFLAERVPELTIAMRHTVGLIDPLQGEHGLVAAIRRDGYHYFKIKLGGNLDQDLLRLAEIGSVLMREAPASWVTLDANEQYAGADDLQQLAELLSRSPELEAIRSRLLYIEQPMPRERSANRHLGKVGQAVAFIIDEADDGYQAFVVARDHGYRGVSSKACKGLYKSLLNGVRAEIWNREAGEKKYFIAGEDLTCQAGLAVQQDTALASFLGIKHVERNGHQYGNGFGRAPSSEVSAFVKAHPDLYTRASDNSVLNIRDGQLAISSLAGIGFASGAHPDWASLDALIAPP
jgi:L-alanine-DL-glutamate epimerase-like enolase superfamily enzyme